VVPYLFQSGGKKYLRARPVSAIAAAADGILERSRKYGQVEEQAQEAKSTARGGEYKETLAPVLAIRGVSNCL